MAPDSFFTIYIYTYSGQPCVLNSSCTNNGIITKLFMSTFDTVICHCCTSVTKSQLWGHCVQWAGLVIYKYLVNVMELLLII